MNWVGHVFFGWYLAKQWVSRMMRNIELKVGIALLLQRIKLGPVHMERSDPYPRRMVRLTSFVLCSPGKRKQKKFTLTLGVPSPM